MATGNITFVPRQHTLCHECRRVRRTHCSPNSDKRVGRVQLAQPSSAPWQFHSHHRIFHALQSCDVSYAHGLTVLCAAVGCVMASPFIGKYCTSRCCKIAISRVARLRRSSQHAALTWRGLILCQASTVQGKADAFILNRGCTRSWPRHTEMTSGSPALYLSLTTFWVFLFRCPFFCDFIIIMMSEVCKS